MSTWFRQGVIALVNNSDIVTGTGTQWVDNVLPGGIFYTPTLQYEVARVISDTSLQLVKPYAGPSVSNVEYAIAPTQGYVLALANQFGLVLQNFGDVRDAWLAGLLVDTTVLAEDDGTEKVGFVASGLGAVRRNAAAKLREQYSLADYFNPTEGAPAMSNALNRLFAVADRQNVQVDLGELSWTLNSDFVIPTSKRAIFTGRGSVNFAGGSIVRNVHGKLTVFHGLTATGANSMFRFQATPSGTATKDYEIDCIEALMNPNVWAIQLDGAREGAITRAYFRSGNGVFRTLSNICVIDRSHFLGLDYAILDDGKGSGFSCGLYICHTEILGCNIPLVVSQCDDGELLGCTVDYNDQGIYLLSQDRFKISGGYLGTRTAERATPNAAIGGTTPALALMGTAAIPCEKIKVLGVCFSGHHTVDGQYDNVYMEYTTGATFADTDFTFWTRNGLRYGPGVNTLNVHDSTFANRGGTGTYAIESSGPDDSTNRIHDNVLPTGKGILAPFANVRRNTRFQTSQQGESVAGAGAGTVAAALTLAFAPNKGDVTLTPTNAAVAIAGPYISAVSATQLVIGFATAPTANAGVRWKVEKNQIAG
jgi:hypothetical protein